MTNRREFLIAGTAGATMLCLGCGSQEPEPGWETPAHTAGDIRMQALHYAMLASSSHNTQPWRIQLIGSGVRLYVDRSRLLPASDPPGRQSHISQGTFLELLYIAARQFGYRADIRYFPEGEYANSVIEDKPVADVIFVPDRAVMRDSLFDEIPKRVSNKRPFEVGREITDAEVNALRSAPQSSSSIAWRIVSDVQHRTDLADLCKQAMATEVSSVVRNRETANWFRFSDRELRERRDGFGLAQSGTDGAKKWFVETFVLSREKAQDPHSAFAKGAVAQTEQQGDTASIFAALVSNTNTRLDQVLAGRAYARVELTASRLGLAMQPLSQLLEEYAEMAPLQRRMKQAMGVADSKTVQMLFRLGHAKATPHSPRREIAALILPYTQGSNQGQRRREG